MSKLSQGARLRWLVPAALMYVGSTAAISNGLNSADGQSIGFTGYVKDPESGLYYANARYYDPAIGRFITADPAEGDPMLPISLHPYLYANANPTRFVDPTGKYSDPGHYLTALYVALRAHLSPVAAQKFAFFVQLPDQADSLDAIANQMEAVREMVLGGSPSSAQTHRDETQQGLHSLTGGIGYKETSATVQSIEDASGDLAAQGLLTHRLGDTFAHRDIRDFSPEAKNYRTGWGHGAVGHDPDVIQRRPERYLEYVKTLAFALGREQGLTGKDLEDFSIQVQSELKSVADIPVVVPDPGDGYPVSLQAQGLFGVPSVVNAVPLSQRVRSNGELDELSRVELRRKIEGLGVVDTYRPEQIELTLGSLGWTHLRRTESKTVSDAVEEFNARTGAVVDPEEAKRGIYRALQLIEQNREGRGAPTVIVENPSGL